jgi:hypothetical protein
VETTVAEQCYYRLVSTDDVDSVSREQIDLKVYLPPATPQDALRYLEIDGVRYDVQGTPFQQWNPRLGRDAYLVVSVRRAAS